MQTSVLRAHPVGVHIGPVFGTWSAGAPRFEPSRRDPVADLDWLDVVGPPDAAGQRMLARARGGLGRCRPRRAPRRLAGAIGGAGRVARRRAHAGSRSPARRRAAGRLPPAAASRRGHVRGSAARALAPPGEGAHAGTCRPSRSRPCESTCRTSRRGALPSRPAFAASGRASGARERRRGGQRGGRLRQRRGRGAARRRPSGRRSRDRTSRWCGCSPTGCSTPSPSPPRGPR